MLNDRIEKQRIWPRKKVDLAIELSTDGKMIGSISLVIQRDDDRIASFGYAINRRYWGQGYATETAEALLGRAFQTLRLHRVMFSKKGEWRDSYLYARIDDINRNNSEHL